VVRQLGPAFNIFAARQFRRERLTVGISFHTKSPFGWVGSGNQGVLSPPPPPPGGGVGGGGGGVGGWGQGKAGR
jgi:hypothetical protein